MGESCPDANERIIGVALDGMLVDSVLVDIASGDGILADKEDGGGDDNAKEDSAEDDDSKEDCGAIACTGCINSTTLKLRSTHHKTCSSRLENRLENREDSHVVNLVHKSKYRLSQRQR
ncbi:MAG: hypothetical protein F6K09_25830 [Merismopedia sp. SIO2A8]|nr:hypothetical protein [Merismopedia sp. SIO2A8]